MIDDRDLSESTLRRILWDALEQYPTSDLLELLADDDCIVRTSAAKQLHFRPTDEVARALRSHLSDQRDYVREIAAFALGQLGTPEKPFKALSNAWLLELLSQDSSHEVRAAAAAALGHLFVDESLPEATEQALALAAGDPHATVRSCVAFALSAHPDSTLARRALDQLGRDEDAEVRLWASDDE